MRTIRRKTVRRPGRSKIRRLLAKLLIRLGKPQYALAVRGWMPMAGAEEPPAGDPPKTDPPQTDPPADPPKTDPPKTDPPAGDPPKTDPPQTGRQAPTQADLDKAYEKLRAREAELEALKPKAQKWDQHERSQLSDAERLQQERDEAARNAETATDKLRRANLLVELAKPVQVTGPDGQTVEIKVADPKAAAKLISGVEFDSDEEPKNLAERVRVLVEEYPLLKGETPAGGGGNGGSGGRPAPNVNGGQGGGGDHHGLTAEEAAMAAAFGIPASDYANYKALHPKLPDPKST